MNNKKKLLLLIVIWLPILLILMYLYYIFNILWNKTNNKADILNTTWNVSSIWTTGNSIWIVLSWEVTNSNNDNQVKQISVYMPDFFETSWMKSIKQFLLKDKKIKVNYVKFKDMNTYQNELILQLAKSNDVDVILIPTDWLDTFKDNWYKLNFSKDISPLFNYIFYDYIKHKDYTFIPYGIDPMVTYVADDSFIKNDTISLQDLKNIIYISDETQSSKKYYFKSLFGISSYDILFMKNNKEVYFNYTLILQQIVVQSILQKTDVYINFFLWLSKNDQYKYRDSRKLEKVVKQLTKKYQDCSLYPNLCVLARWYWNISFGFLSDMDIYEAYYAKIAKNWVKLKYYNFPIANTNYPARWWGFLINKKSKNLVEVSNFINEYMTTGLKWNSSIWYNLLSPFNNILSTQKLDKKYSSLLKYLDLLEIIYWWNNIQKEFIKSIKLIETLEWQYSLNAFLENTNLDFIKVK